MNLVQVDVSPDNEEEFGGISTDPMPEEEAWVLVKLILKYVPDVRVFMRASPEARPPRMTYTPLDDEL